MSSNIAEWHIPVLDVESNSIPQKEEYHPYPSFSEVRYAANETGVTSSLTTIMNDLRVAVEENSPLLLCNEILNFYYYGQRVTTWLNDNMHDNQKNWFFDLRDNADVGPWANCVLWCKKDSTDAFFGNGLHGDDGTTTTETDFWYSVGTMYEIMVKVLAPLKSIQPAYSEVLTTRYPNDQGYCERVIELRVAISRKPAREVLGDAIDTTISKPSTHQKVFPTKVAFLKYCMKDSGLNKSQQDKVLGDSSNQTKRLFTEIDRSSKLSGVICAPSRGKVTFKNTRLKRELIKIAVDLFSKRS